MEEKDRLEEIEPLLPGNKAFRIRRRRPRRRLRITPSIPGILRFLGDVAIKTPLIPLLVALIVLWLISSWAIYMVEHSVNEQITSYSYALWWSFTAMQTQGANAPGPITAAGMIIGAVWSIFSTVAFFGVIIGTLYSYFMFPRHNRSQELINAIQYNLEEIEKLSIDELQALKETTARLIDAQISHLHNIDFTVKPEKTG